MGWLGMVGRWDGALRRSADGERGRACVSLLVTPLGRVRVAGGCCDSHAAQGDHVQPKCVSHDCG